MPEPIFELTSISDEPTPVVPATPPSETPTPEVIKEGQPAAPAPVTDPGTVTPVTEQLYELPDGRKVNLEEFQKQWKDHFYPEYTRKSQELAELKRGNPPTKPDINNPQNTIDQPWKDPNYEPKNYAEIIEIATREAEKKIFEKQEAEMRAKAQVEERVTADLAEIRAKDPNLDESKLFSHANKYGFTDLKAAYQNYSDVQNLILTTEEKVKANLQKRENTPVAGANNPAPVVSNNEVDRSEVGNFQSAADYFNSLRGK